jgi:predicted site-specific integrase-resolvase
MKKKLSAWAKEHGYSYRGAYGLWKSGNFPLKTEQLPTGTILVIYEDDTPEVEHVVTYARVSSSENKSNLSSQSKRLQDFCSANGWIVNQVVEECASGLNDKRPKLQKLLKEKQATKIIVEHKDRLTRFGLEYIKTLYPGEIIVINESDNDEQDLMEDFISLVTSFCSRLYGQRRCKRKTEKIIQELKNDKID